MKIVLLLLVLLGSFSGCSDRYETIQPPIVPVSSPVTSEESRPAVNANKTTALFKLITKKALGNTVGLVEMRSEGLLLRPGESRPTEVSFKLSRSYRKLSVRSFIALPPDEATIKKLGLVRVEFLLDGKSRGKFLVYRGSMLSKDFDLTNIDTLTIVVDNGDGNPWFDWFMLRVVELQ